MRLFRGDLDGVSGFVQMSDGTSAGLYDYRQDLGTRLHETHRGRQCRFHSPDECPEHRQGRPTVERTKHRQPKQERLS